MAPFNADEEETLKEWIKNRSYINRLVQWAKNIEAYGSASTVILGFAKWVIAVSALVILFRQGAQLFLSN